MPVIGCVYAAVTMLFRNQVIIQMNINVSYFTPGLLSALK